MEFIYSTGSRVWVYKITYFGLAKLKEKKYLHDHFDPKIFPNVFVDIEILSYGNKLLFYRDVNPSYIRTVNSNIRDWTYSIIPKVLIHMGINEKDFAFTIRNIKWNINTESYEKYYKEMKRLLW
jgi:hypothetical protein